MSATRKALRIVDSTAALQTTQVDPAVRPGSVLDDGDTAAGGLDGGTRRLREPVSGHVELLGQLALAEHLNRHVSAGRQAGGPQRVRRDVSAGLEARFQVGQVDRLGVRPERLERHRHLLVRTAQLAHPHVDRRLAALEAGAVLGAGTRAVALVPATRRLAVPGAVAAADALAVLARPGGRLERVQADAGRIDG